MLAESLFVLEMILVSVVYIRGADRRDLWEHRDILVSGLACMMHWSRCVLRLVAVRRSSQRWLGS